LAVMQAAQTEAAQERLAALRADGEAAIARRAEMVAAYEEAAAGMLLKQVADAFEGAIGAEEEAEAVDSAEDGETAEAAEEEKEMAVAEGKGESDLEGPSLSDAKDTYERAQQIVEKLQVGAEEEAAADVAAAAVPGPSPVAAPPPPPLPPMPTPPPVGEPAGALARDFQLPLAVTNALVASELQDPTKMSREDQDNSLGAIAAGTGLLFLLPLFEIGFFGDLALSSILGGGLAAYAALRKDTIGTLTRDVGGKTARTTFDKAKAYERENQLTEKAIAKTKEAVAELKKKIAEEL